MSLEFTDSFDIYSAISDRYEFSRGTLTLSATAVRTGTKGLIVGNNGNMRKNVNVNNAFCVGAAVNIRTATPTGPVNLFAWCSVTQARHCAIRINTSRNIELINTSGTVITTGATPLSATAWHYVEALCTPGTAGTGTITVNVDGVLLFTTTGVTICDGSGDPNVYQIDLGDSAQSNSGTIYWLDDLYVTTLATGLGGGGTNSGILGPVTIQPLVPTSAGSFTTFNLTGDTSNWHACIDENGDTSYISSATPGLRESFRMTAFTSTFAILGIQVMASLRKDSAGARAISLGVRSAGADAFGPVVGVSDNYGYLSVCVDNDPATGLPWTLTGMTSSECGIQVVS